MGAVCYFLRACVRCTTDFSGLNLRKCSSSFQAIVNRCLSLSRLGHSTIAHRFSGGINESLSITAPLGATDLPAMTLLHWPFRDRNRKRLPSLTGLVGLPRSLSHLSGVPRGTKPGIPPGWMPSCTRCDWILMTSPPSPDVPCDHRRGGSPRPERRRRPA